MSLWRHHEARVRACSRRSAYAEILDIPSAFSSNGNAFASRNKVPSAGEDIETQFTMGAFPGPDELWQRYKAYRGMRTMRRSLSLMLA